MRIDHDNFVNPTPELVEHLEAQQPVTLAERLKADVDAGAHYSLERIAIQKSTIAYKTRGETDIDKTVTPEEAKKYDLKIDAPISPLELELRLQFQKEGREIQERFARNLSWSRPFSSIQSILTMGLIAGNTPSAKTMDLAIGSAFGFLTGPLGGILAAGTHRAVRTVPLVHRALKAMSNMKAAQMATRQAQALKQATLQSDSIQNVKRLNDLYNKKFKGSASIGAANTLEEFMVASYDAEQGIDDPQASQYALAFFAPAVFKGVMNAAAGGVVRAEQRIFKPDVEKPKPSFKDEFTYEKVGEPLKDDAPDTEAAIKEAEAQIDRLLKSDAVEDIRTGKIKPEELMDDATPIKEGSIFRKIIDDERGAMNLQDATKITKQLKEVFNKFKDESGMKAVRELLDRPDIDDLIMKKATGRGHVKLTAALKEPTKANIRSLATFIKKPAKKVNRPLRMVENVQKELDKSDSMTEVLVRMEGLDNIQNSAWNELLNIFSEAVITEKMTDVAKALMTAGIKFDSQDLFPILRSPETVKARLAEFKRQNPHIDTSHARTMGPHFERFIEPDLRTVGEYLQTKGIEAPDKMKRDVEPAEVKPEVKLKEDTNEIIESGLGYGNMLDALKDSKIKDMVHEDRTRRRDWVSTEEIESWNKIKPKQDLRLEQEGVIRDEKGSPMNLYRGSTEGGIRDFMWFSDTKKIGKHFAYKQLGTYHLIMKNPIIIDAKDKFFNEISAKENPEAVAVLSKYGIKPEEGILHLDALMDGMQTFKGRLEHDGIIVKNVYEGAVDLGTSTTYMSFKQKNVIPIKKVLNPEEQLKAIRKAVKEPQKQEFDDYGYKADGENEYGEAVDDMLTRSDEVIDHWSKCIEGTLTDGE